MDELCGSAVRDRPDRVQLMVSWNGFVERLIGSIRRDYVDRIIVLGEAHLRRILKSYARYYNETRTHLALDKAAPVSRPVQRIGVVRSPPSWADFITTTPEFRFSVLTGPKRAAPLPRWMMHRA
jgi:hypothetical protein